MLTTYDEFIPLISQLNHADKLRLAQWLINIIATEEGITPIKAAENKNQSGLCGIWQDSRTDKTIVDEIINSRTMGREITL
jgi:hypothetical protein